MEVKSIYLDLQKAELKKNGKKSVWRLESEAFKEPLELTIGYEDKEIEEFRKKYDGLLKVFHNIEEELDLWNTIQVNDQNKIKELEEYLVHNEVVMAKLNEKIDSQNKEISSLYKVIADLKTTVETLSGTILHLGNKVKELEKKITKQPMVFQDKTFISGHEAVGLSMIEIPSGEYLLISSYDIGNANEYVDNVPYTRYDKITVSDNQYIPMYRLIGGTDLDIPTADIFWTLVFIPC